MIRTGLIVDANNLYFSVQSTFAGRRIRFENYVKALEKLGHTLTYKIMYSGQKTEVSENFITALEMLGFECHFGNCQWDIAMALRAADIMPNIDCFVLGSNNEGAGRMLFWAKEHGKIVKCFAHNIPAYYRQMGDCLEISEDLLSPKKCKQ